MEEPMPWLVGRIGKKCWLLAKDEQAYYLIEVGKNLDWETEEWLMQQGVSEALLKELNLAFTYIPQKDIRGVAFSGSEAGDCVYLYLRSEKRKLTLELNYDPEWMETFFENLHRFAAPNNKKPGDKGWRKEYQDKDTFEKLKIVPPICLVSGLTAGISWVFTRHWLVFTACLLLLAAQTALAVCFPVYFTIFLPKGKKKQNVWNLDVSMWCTGVWLLFSASADWLDFGGFRWMIPLSICLSILIYWRVRDLHEDPWGYLCCLLMCCIIVVFLAGQANVVYDFTLGESWVVKVEDLSSSGGRHRDYYCTVILPDGETEKIRISGSLYRELEEGDYVRVEHNIGALGMEYTKVEAME